MLQIPGESTLKRNFQQIQVRDGKHPENEKKLPHLNNDVQFFHQPSFAVQTRGASALGNSPSSRASSVASHNVQYHDVSVDNIRRPAGVPLLSLQSNNGMVCFLHRFSVLVVVLFYRLFLQYSMTCNLYNIKHLAIFLPFLMLPLCLHAVACTCRVRLTLDFLIIYIYV